jgi:hypothetical protein
MAIAQVLVNFYQPSTGHWPARYRLCWTCGYWLARSCEARELKRA